jgi:tetratricopeptide (TPR) repeat protein
MFRISSVALMLTLAGALFAADPAVEKARKEIAAKKYDEAITALEAAHKKNPKSAEVTKALADAYLAKGDSFMYNDQLPPRMKYPTALKAYRQVLVYDKTNKKAQTQIATIEGIYKSMGRPVPQ